MFVPTECAPIPGYPGSYAPFIGHGCADVVTFVCVRLHRYRLPNACHVAYLECTLCLRVRVMWSDIGGSDVWYTGTIKGFSRATEEHQVVYDDGDVQWINIKQYEDVGLLEFLDPPPLRQRVNVDDSVPHYIVYNADTRVLCMYPNVCVLEPRDVSDPLRFALQLARAPHYLYVAPDPLLVRQVFVKVSCPHTMSLPHACSRFVQKYCKV